MKDNKFTLTFSNFNLGQAPLAHLDSLSSIGNTGHYSTATNVDIITKPGLLTQGPALANLNNGTQAGSVTDQVNFIMDKAVTDEITYGISDTLLHRFTPTEVTANANFPRSVTNMTEGSSVIDFQGYLWYFYNKASGGDCGRYDLASTFDDDYMSTIPSGAVALQNAPHPVAKKQDILLFGNGRYVGLFISTGVTLNATKLDFGVGSECADIVFDANQWWLAINSGVTTGSNRASSQIYLYDGGAISAQLSDEVAVGVQKIGFIYPVNGVKYVAYQDVSSVGGFIIGYISGRSIKALRHFTGTLPTFAQKTLYKNTITFISDGKVYSVGAVVDQLPVQISQLADAGYATAGALAAPFGTPMVASTDGSSNFRVAQFSGYDTACTWKSIVIPLMRGADLGYIDKVIVATNTLGAGASCSLTLEVDQASSTSGAKTITTTGKRRHVLKGFNKKAVEDFRLALSWSGGSASNNVAIRSIQVMGHWVEKS